MPRSPCLALNSASNSQPVASGSAMSLTSRSKGFSAGERARLLGVPGCLDVVSSPTQQPRENFAGVVMILHKEQPQAFAPCRSYSVGGKPAHFRMGLGDGRQFKAKGRAFAQPSAGGGERAAVRFGDRFANRQPEPEAPDPLLERVLDLEERIEDVPQRPRVNPDACIAKLDGQMASLVAARFDGDPPTRGREFDSVLDQIPKDLLEPAGIPVHQVPRGVELERELESFAVDLRLADSDRLLETQVHIDRFRDAAGACRRLCV